MIITYVRKLRLLNRNVRLFLISVATNGFCYYGISGLLSNIYLLRLGYGPKFIGLLSGVGFLTYALSGLPAGALGVRWGSRRTMIAGMAVTAVTPALTVLNEVMPPAIRAGWLMAVSLLGWLGGGLYTVNGYPFLTASTSPEERNHAFSIRVALWPLVGSVGNLVGGMLPGFFAATLGVSLDDPAPYRYPLLIPCLLYGFVALPALLATREVHVERAPETRSKGKRERVPYGLIVAVAFPLFLRVSGEWAARIFFNVYMDAGLHAPTSLIGALAAVGQLLAAPAALVTPLVIDRLGKERTIVLGALGVTLSLLPLALVPHWGAAGIGLAGIVSMAAVTTATGSIFSQEIVPPRWRAAMAGASNMAWGLSTSMMSIGGGYVIATWGYRSLFLMGACLTTLGALLFWAIFRVPRGEFARSTRQRELVSLD